MNTTVRMKASEIYKDWHVIDAAGQPLGRVASQAAHLIRGKHKPTYEPHLDDGDFVIIINASQVRVTGRKQWQIKYRTHSGYPGGLKTRTYEEQMARFPERVLEQAVYGMLPKGSLGEAMRKHLKVYRGANHRHQSQIVGSQKAQAARQAAIEAALGEPMKAPRLRPLSTATVVAMPGLAVTGPGTRARRQPRPEATASLAPTPEPDEEAALEETIAPIEDELARDEIAAQAEE